MDAVAQKMTDLGVPTAELGFAPLQTSALQTSVFQQSRVPSQRRQTVVQDQLPARTRRRPSPSRCRARTRLPSVAWGMQGAMPQDGEFSAQAQAQASC